MVKVQSYLAGCVFSLLLAGHIAMALLDAYPSNGYLWHLNLLFARDIRPLLDELDLVAGGGPLSAVVVLSIFAGISVLAARRNLRVVAAANCHIALGMVLLVAVRSYRLASPRGLSDNLGDLALAAAHLSWMQVGMFILAGVLLAFCLWTHVQFVRRAMHLRRARAAVPSEDSVAQA